MVRFPSSPIVLQSEGHVPIGAVPESEGTTVGREGATVGITDGRLVGILET